MTIQWNALHDNSNLRGWSGVVEAQTVAVLLWSVWPAGVMLLFYVCAAPQAVLFGRLEVGGAGVKG